ncbi:DUF6233 domain-containing protein [Streptomyces lavendofoliae]|uniref:Uncharacterized protein n=1 Tax=Streptomyces lavendofoliae TaxID=67314 RepID=A0A918I4Z3_9ACTN|nr:DUF6233 domain-containing protein [Streptomyces lavendofoliae]GGU61424.1 hypothetical protein GCM10010274_57890 [Streptomyces lavendofoliae]
MYEDLPPDLSRLRTLETWLVLSLDRVRRRILEVEMEQAASGSRVEPPDVRYRMQRGVDEHRAPVKLHVNGCVLGKKGMPIGEADARRALSEQIPACGICRPGTELGILDAG